MTTPRTAAGRVADAALDTLSDAYFVDEPTARRMHAAIESIDIAAIEDEAIRQERARLAEAVEREFAEMREDDPDARWLGMTREGVLALLREEDTPNG